MKLKITEKSRRLQIIIDLELDGDEIYDIKKSILKYKDSLLVSGEQSNDLQETKGLESIKLIMTRLYYIVDKFIE